MEIVTTLKELLHLHPLYNEQLKSFANFGGDFHDASRLSDMGASLTSASEDALQAVLEQLSVPDRWVQGSGSRVQSQGSMAGLRLQQKSGPASRRALAPMSCNVSPVGNATARGCHALLLCVNHIFIYRSCVP